MPVIVMLKMQNQSEYDSVANELLRRGVTSNLAVTHAAASTDDGFLVVDIWPSRQEWDDFVNNQLQPSVQAVGLSTQPQVKIYEAYNVGWPGRFAEAETRPGAF